ncbi:uncharacterized protein LOC106161963 [Lingula anatina]|uniref:Uncharacterized protein LOC106161963 n=1 Tax=Lingula anatina TaxID=7574 RepID=A0A1S3I8B3_LINAN|nr:uncharacterized protein LOC106161963 [Lingula anatina]|eukprot:XP_013394497.1 uncharacterized protein LOC106161963 [Lingula anatina]
MHLFHVYVWPLIAVLAGNCAKGSGISGTNGYVEYFPGTPDSQVIITAAHGGYLKPSSIPDRTKGCLSGSTCIWTHTCGSTSSQCTAKTVRDTKTKELATELTKALETQTGKRPHLIVNHLSRVKLDPNREIGEATFNVAAALTAFNEYHQFITDARANITGAGLLFDMHGQSHPEKWIELGYLMSKN